MSERDQTAENGGGRVPDLMAALEASLARAKQDLERCPTCNGLVRVRGRHPWGFRLMFHLDGQGSLCSQTEVKAPPIGRAEIGGDDA